MVSSQFLQKFFRRHPDTGKLLTKEDRFDLDLDQLKHNAVSEEELKVLKKNKGGSKATTTTKEPALKKPLKKKVSLDVIVVDPGRFSAASPPSTTVSNSTDPLKDATISDMMRSTICLTNDQADLLASHKDLQAYHNNVLSCLEALEGGQQASCYESFFSKVLSEFGEGSSTNPHHDDEEEEDL